MQFQFYTFEELDTQTLYEILKHRFEVFILGQRNIYPDLDGLDQNAIHLVARDTSGVIAGYVRLFPVSSKNDEHTDNSFGRLSVKEKFRNQGLGTELVERACEWLQNNNYSQSIRISAMSYLKDFYQKLGFEPISEIFDIAGVPHITMIYHT